MYRLERIHGVPKVMHVFHVCVIINACNRTSIMLAELLPKAKNSRVCGKLSPFSRRLYGFCPSRTFGR